MQRFTCRVTFPMYQLQIYAQDLARSMNTLEKLPTLQSKYTCEILQDKISKLKYQINFSPEKRDRIDVISYFMAPESKKVNEEYLLYDLIGVIGAVGGTLGLCIGFSIFGIHTILFFFREKMNLFLNLGMILSGLEVMELLVEQKIDSNVTKVEPIMVENDEN